MFFRSAAEGRVSNRFDFSTSGFLQTQAAPHRKSYGALRWRFESGAQKAARALARATTDVDRGCLNMTHHPLSLTLSQIDSVRNIFTTKKKLEIRDFLKSRFILNNRKQKQSKNDA